MKYYQYIGLWITGIALTASVLIFGMRSFNNYRIDNPNFTSSSRATGYFHIGNKIEYTKLKDGSEEILTRDGRKISRYQNFDGNNTIDRIRTDKLVLRDIFKLEHILTRASDSLTNKVAFDNADSLLQEERQKNIK